MGSNYKFHNPEGVYFVSFSVVKWIDVFSRNLYREIIVESLNYCQKNKGMEIFAWCLMSNHMHIVFRSLGDEKPESILGDFKKYTSRRIVETIKENRRESRREWLLEQFSNAALQSSNVKNYQFWQHDNHPIELWSNRVIAQKINYIHQNPVKAGLVYCAEDYVFSSAKDYSGEIGVLAGVVVVK